MWWRQALGFYGTLLAAATPYFVVFWRWFDYWRRHRVRTYALIAVTFLGVGVAVYSLRDWALPHTSGPAWPIQALGWVIIAVASVLGTVADRQLGFRVRSFTPFFERHGHLDLLTTGAYGVVRHPIYAAGIWVQAGIFLVTGYLSVLAAFAVFGLGAIWFTRQEEARLVALLDDPAEYDRYRARVPALLPRLF